jgi:long-chain acyl-CoA synthetase
VIVLASGETIDPEEVESHYKRSPFIGDLCVIGVGDAGASTSERLHALVVPDFDVLRERRIVNIRELIRFELEGLSISLPSHKRVVSFGVSMKPLPRGTAGKLKRDDILEQHRTGCASVPPETPAPMDDHTARVVALVQASIAPGSVVGPHSNLELDLGLDSIERVELLASLEQRFGRRVPDDIAHRVFLVGDVAEAFRGATENPDSPDFEWASLLETKEPGAELRALLGHRTVTAFAVCGVLRLLVRLFVRPRVDGLEHLPRRGPFIISPNHQSYIDPLVLMGVLPFGVLRQLFFVGAAEYFQTPLTAWLARALNVVPVDPDANLVPAMQAGAFGLKHGRILMLFPEGERSIDGRVKQFKKGAAILSQHLDTPIVPVAIQGVFEIWPRNRPIDWSRLFPWSGHRARIRFGAPLGAPSGKTSAADRTAALRASVEAMWLDVEAAATE